MVASGMQCEPPGADPHAGWCGRGQGEPAPLPQFDEGRLARHLAGPAAYSTIRMRASPSGRRASEWLSSDTFRVSSGTRAQLMPAAAQAAANSAVQMSAFVQKASLMTVVATLDLSTATGVRRIDGTEPALLSVVWPPVMSLGTDLPVARSQASSAAFSASGTIAL